MTWRQDSDGVEIKCPFSLKESVCGQAELWGPIIISLMCQNKVLFEHVELSHHTSVVKGRFETCLGLRKPRVFLHHELIVYFITHFFGLWVCSSETSRTPIKTIIPRWEKLSPLYVSLLSCCLVPLTGPFCPGRWNMCHLPWLARLAVGLMEHSLRDDNGNWQGLYIIMCNKRRQWP